MKHWWFRILGLLLLLCVESTYAIGNKATDKSNRSAAGATFSYVAVGDVPKAVMGEIKQTLEKNYQAIAKHYEVETMPPVTVKVWQDRQAFERAYGDDAKYVQGYVVDANWEIRFFNGRPALGMSVVHEFTHLVTIAANPSFNNDPRWLWEAVAIYESGRPPVPQLSNLNCVSEEVWPTLQNLDEHPFNIYKTGFYLTDYIVKTWGREKLNMLIRSNGDIETVLNISVKDFEQNWIKFLRKNYHFKNSADAQTDC